MHKICQNFALKNCLPFRSDRQWRQWIPFQKIEKFSICESKFEQFRSNEWYEIEVDICALN